MERRTLFFFSTMVILFLFVPTIPRGTADDSAAFSMEGVEAFIRGRAQSALRRALSEQGSEWLAETIAQVCNQHGWRSGNGKLDLKQFVAEANPELKQAVAEELKRRLTAWLPIETKRILREDIFQNVLSKEQLAQLEQLETRIDTVLETSANTAADQIVGPLYDQTLAGLRRQMTEAGVGFVDPTDLRGTIQRTLSTAAITNVVADQLSQVVGASTVAGIRSTVTSALNGQLPDEALQAMARGRASVESYVTRVRENLPGARLHELTDTFLTQPLVTLPTEAYAGILAGSAATHFAKAFSGVFVDPQELKRGIEVTRVMVWQLRKKQRINLSVMEFGGIARELAAGLGAAAAFDRIAARVRAPLDRIQTLADDIDHHIVGKIDEAKEEWWGAIRPQVEELRGELEKVRAAVREPIDDLQKQLDRVASDVSSKLPADFNGLPPSWAALKKKAGMEDGIFGKAGDATVNDGLAAVRATVGDGLATLNNRVAEGIATASAEVIDQLHLLGPAAKILDVEKVPPTSPPASDELDPVLLHNGEFIHMVTDLVIPGRGIDFSFTRSYRSRSDFLGPLGWHWTYHFAERLRRWDDGPEGKGFTYVTPAGMKIFFRETATGFVAPPGVFDQLTRSDDAGQVRFVLRTSDGFETIFGPGGLLIARRDRFGNELQFGYDAQGNLIRIVDTLGRTICLGYRPDRLLTELVDFTGRRFAFLYDDQQQLVGVTSPATIDAPNGTTTAYHYNSHHQLTQIVDPNGNLYLENEYGSDGVAADRVVAQRYGDGDQRVTITYPAANQEQRVRVTDRRGTTREYELDRAGHIIATSWIDRLGHAVPLVRYRYNDAGQETQRCFPSGRCIASSFAGKDLVSEALIPSDGGAPRVTTFSSAPTSVVDPYGRVTQRTDPRGVVDRFVYGDDGRGLLARVVRDALALPTRTAAGTPAQATTTYAYDAVGNVIAITDPTGAVTHLTVDARSRVTQEKLPDGSARHYRYDANDNVTEITVVAEGKIIFATTFAYDTLDHLTVKKERVTADRFITTHFAYDADGLLMRIILPAGNDIVYQRDPLGQLTCVVRASTSLDRSRTCVERDGDGVVTALVDANGNRTRLMRNGYGAVVKIVDPLGNVQASDRDALGRETATRWFDAQGKLLAAERVQHTSSGAMTKRERGLWREDSQHPVWLAQEWQYDAGGFIIAQRDPAGSETHYQHDGLGRIVTIVDALGNRTELRYDLAARTVTHQEIPAGKETGPTWTATYDALGRMIATQDPLGGTWSSTFDALGNLIATSDPMGVITHEQWDDVGRRTVISKELDGKPITTRLTWDDNGRLTTITDPLGAVTSFSYDDLDQQVSEHFPDGSERRTARDGRGNVSGVIERGGASIVQRSDALGQLVESQLVTNRASVSLQRFRYDGLGRLVDAWDANDPQVASDDVHSQFSYDSLSRVVGEAINDRWVKTTYTVTDSMASVVGPAGEAVYYERDPLDRITGMLGSAGRVASFSYGVGDQLTHVDYGNGLVFARTLDPLGRPLEELLRGRGPAVMSLVYHYDPAWRLIGVDDRVAKTSEAYRYDTLGRLVEHQGKETTRYDFDLVGNRRDTPPSSIDTDGRISDDGQLRYHYDAFQRLTTVTNPDGALIARYRYDALGRRAAKIVGDQITETSYRGWQPVEFSDATSSRWLVAGDVLDETWAVAEGDAVTSLHHDRLGSVRAVSDRDGHIAQHFDYDPWGNVRADAGPLGFTGRERDAETGLLYFRHRYYDPQRGAFLTPDPLGVSTNFFAPTRFITPFNFSFHHGLGQAARTAFADWVPRADGDINLIDVDRLHVQSASLASADVETNLYRYAGGDPVNGRDPLGLYRMLLYRDLGSTGTGRLILYPEASEQPVGMWEARTLGEYRDRTRRFGDTPNGYYRVGRLAGGTLDWRDPKRPRSFGTGEIEVIGIAGDVFDAPRRNGFFIHGGGNSRRIRHPFAPRQGWVNTLGCVRMQNEDLNQLIADIHGLEERGDEFGSLRIITSTE